MPPPTTLFEVSWDVGHRIGGVHTALATKARASRARWGDRYVVVGPWLLGGEWREPVLREEPGHEAFADACRSMGVPVRVGRWLVPGEPRAILVDASGLLARKDDLLKRLWEAHAVDSLLGGWRYVEPVLFGHAAGMAIDRWCREHVAPVRARAAATFHEWTSAAGLLYLRSNAPQVGTVFVVHGTALARAEVAAGRDPRAATPGDAPAARAERDGVRSEHSLEAAAAREADVLAAIGEEGARDLDDLHGRRPSHVLARGIDAEVVDALAGDAPRAAVRETLARLASALLGEDVGDAAMVAVTGRQGRREEGLRPLVEAAKALRDGAGRRVVAWWLVPTPCGGVRREVLERLRAPEGADAVGDAKGAHVGDPALGACTHNLLDPEGDPVARALEAARAPTADGRRALVVHVPAPLSIDDGLLGLPYEAILRALDATLHAGEHDAPAYGALESLAAGVPIVVADGSAAARWAQREGLGERDGVAVVDVATGSAGAAPATGVRDAATVGADLAAAVRRLVASPPPADAAACRAAAGRLSWERALDGYEAATTDALATARARRGPEPATARAGRGGDPTWRAPSLPAPLADLARLSRNLAWTWDPDAPALFAQLCPSRWDAFGHDPVRLLREADPADVSRRAADPEYVARVARAAQRLDAYVAASPSADARRAFAPLSPSNPVAYFCAEYALHESMPIYAGGLGVLAADHLKAASDLHLPLVGVGLLYRRGYVRQEVTAAGDQASLDVVLDPADLPLERVRDAQGRTIPVTLELPGARVTLVAWRADVGRVPLYLLDADVPENRPEDRAATHRLYGGDDEMRLRQEVLLGRGGVRLLEALGLRPAVVHLNEGHAAFAPLERLGRLVHEAGLTFDEALEIVRATTAFTTHTPVPAGHDRFSEALLRRYFSDVETWLGTTWERFLELGRSPAEPELFNLTALGLRLSRFRNGVSELHGRVSRRLLAPLWPGLRTEEVPVGHVTNGVHLPTWTAPATAAALGAKDRPVEAGDFGSAARVPAATLWAARDVARRALLDGLRVRLTASLARRDEPEAHRARVLAGLEPNALLLGFARRFASYKRADLLLADPVRLARLLASPERPVRLLVAGKAHPRDLQAQGILRRVVEAARSDALAGRLVFLEDYDLALGRALTAGVDAWLNLPRRGLEASGTSGMKAAASGALNLSVRDGWWNEAFDGANGWSVGAEGSAIAAEAADAGDGEALFRLLEGEVVPCFFRRDAAGLPTEWLDRVRRSLATIAPRFDARRMVGEYLDRAYRPLARDAMSLGVDGFAPARAAAERHRRIRKGFAAVRVTSVAVTAGDADSAPRLRVQVDLGPLAPADVVVEAVGPDGTAAACLLPEGDAQGTVRTFAGPAPSGAGGGGNTEAGTGPGTGAGAGQGTAAVVTPPRIRVIGRPHDPDDDALLDLGVWSSP